MNEIEESKTTGKQSSKMLPFSLSTYITIFNT